MDRRRFSAFRRGSGLGHHLQQLGRPRADLEPQGAGEVMVKVHSYSPWMDCPWFSPATMHVRDEYDQVLKTWKWQYGPLTVSDMG